MNQTQEVGLKELISYFFSNKILILLITAIASFGAMTVSLLIPSVYTSTVVMIPVDKNESVSSMVNQLGGAASLMGIPVNSTNNGTQVNIAQITSRTFSEKFIKNYNLYPELFPDEWDKEKNSWQEGIDVPSSFSIQKKFRDRYSVSEDPRTGLIYLVVEWDNPNVGTQIANNIVKSYEEFAKNETIQESIRSINYLEKEINETSITSVKTALFNLIERESKAKMLATTAHSTAFKVIDPAYKPDFRSWPARKFITSLGFFVGLLVSFIIVLIRFFYINK